MRLLPLLRFLLFLEVLHLRPRVFEFFLFDFPGSEVSLKNLLTRGCLQLGTSGRVFHFRLIYISNLVLFSSLSLFGFVIMILDYMRVLMRN